MPRITHSWLPEFWSTMQANVPWWLAVRLLFSGSSRRHCEKKKFKHMKKRLHTEVVRCCGERGVGWRWWYKYVRSNNKSTAEYSIYLANGQFNRHCHYSVLSAQKISHCILFQACREQLIIAGGECSMYRRQLGTYIYSLLHTQFECSEYFFLFCF